MAEDVICGSDSVKKMHNYVDADGNVYILGEFDDTISENVVPALVKRIKELDGGDPDSKIFFYINSPGGYCHELYNLLALIDMAKQKGIRIYTIITGRAYSCGSMLAIQGDHRAIYKYGTHLMHLGEAGTINHTFKQLERETNNIKEHFENIVKMYVENTNIPEKQIREMLKDDSCFLNAEQCKEMGLVDEIIGEELEPPEVTVKDGMNLEVNGMVIKIKVGNPKENLKKKDKRISSKKDSEDKKENKDKKEKK